MINKTIALFAVTALFSAQGCAAAAVEDPGFARIDYALAELEFETTVQYQLRKCEWGEEELENGDKRAIPLFDVKIAAEASPKISTTNTLEFNPARVALANRKVAQNITLTLYPNGTIKTLNAVSEDKTGSILSNLFKFGTSLLKLAFGFSADVATVQSQPEICNDKTVASLAVANGMVASIKKRKLELYELLGGDDDLADANDQIQAIEKAIDLLNKRLTAYRLEHLTIKKAKRFKADALSRHNFITLSKPELEKWLRANWANTFHALAIGNWISAGWTDSDGNTWSDRPLLAVELHLDKEGSIQPLGSDSSEETTKIYFRRPVRTTYGMCFGPCDADQTQKAAKRLVSGAVSIPQWGVLESVNFEAKAFEKRTLAMSFDETGGVTMLKWDVPSKTSSIFAALASTSEAAVTFADVALYGREVAETKALEVETKLIKQRIALKEAREKYDTLFSTDDTEPEAGK